MNTGDMERRLMRLDWLERNGLHSSLAERVDDYYRDLVQHQTMVPETDDLGMIALPIPPLGAPVEANAEYALEQEEVMAYLPDKKINAIKELRQLTNMGLKEAKDAVELVQYWKDTGRMSRRERAKVEEEALEVIESIKGSMAALHAGAEANDIRLA